MYNFISAILIFSIFFCSCSEDIITSEHDAKNVIGWNVSAGDIASGALPNTRALMNDYLSLKDACSSKEYRDAEKIGLYGKYILDGSSSVIFNNADLWWWVKEQEYIFKDETGDDSHWNYIGDNIYWIGGAEYTFKSYFPKSKVQLQPGSDSDRILATYDTENEQFDMLVAHKKINAGEENPVKLIMKHALAAVKFDFQFSSEGVTDNLIACWLENTTSNGFFTSSTLNFTEDIIWPNSTPAPAGTRFYYWEPYNAVAITSTSTASAYLASAPEGKGAEFTTNEGWILVIPQSSELEGNVKLCFKTSTGGNTVYSAALPAYNFLPGNRYNYHVKISATEINLGLTISDWNERKSSHEIDFNK